MLFEHDRVFELNIVCFDFSFLYYLLLYQEAKLDAQTNYEEIKRELR